MAEATVLISLREELQTVTDPVPTSYDEMPYLGKAFPQTHPDRLGTIARLFGLRPPDLETCRVLELGCASGENLIPMAVGLPDARFVGIDLSARQIEQGRQTVAALGLANIELRHHNIADVDASWGVFDYIICHGIYSWVPAPVREKILAICRENLAADGVAYISYNALPGWHVRGMIRDMMSYHSAPFQGPLPKVQQARALLDFLAQSVPTTLPYGMVLRQELDTIRNEPDAYLFHEHLEEINEPFYFHQFADAAARHGLEYLGEADIGDMLVSNFPDQIAQTLRRISTDLVRMEQYIDFIRNRTFRQTLLIHQGATLRRNLDDILLDGFYVASAARPESARPVLTQGVSETFRTPGGATHNIVDALTKAALVLLAQQWPGCLPFGELAAMSRASLRQSVGTATGEAGFEDDDRSFSARLLQGYVVRAVELRLRPPRLTPTPSARPVASPLVRLQAERGRTVTNLRHEPGQLNELHRRMLPLLDGTRDLDALVAAVVRLAQEGKIGVRVQEGGPAVTDQAVLEKTLRRAVASGLPELATSGLLLA